MRIVMTTTTVFQTNKIPAQRGKQTGLVMTLPSTMMAMVARILVLKTMVMERILMMTETKSSISQIHALLARRVGPQTLEMTSIEMDARTILRMKMMMAMDS